MISVLIVFSYILHINSATPIYSGG